MKATLLLVEDNKVQKLVNERILHRAGYTVLNAADGEEALRVARQTIPDIILLDMLLPKLGGREVMQALRATPSTAQIPVLVFSSLPQVNEGKLKKEGAAGYFVKSRLVGKGSSELDLVEMIERLLEESKKSKPAAIPSSESARSAG